MIKRLTATIGVVVLALGAAACGSSSNDNTSSGGGSASTGSASGPLVGAGSTLVAPLMGKWQPDLSKAQDLTVTYGAIGSGGGIEQITANTVDFGASDAPLTPDQQKAAPKVMMIPWALSATDPVYNLKGGPSDIKLDGPTLANIFLGKIKTWNDPAITQLNPGAKLPATPIKPVYRSDGSGDTYILTDYLSKVSPQWKSQVGNGTEVKFPTGVGGKGNDGVSAVLSSTDGAIAYVGAAYAQSNGFKQISMKNAAGSYEKPTVDSIAAAAAAVSNVPADNAVSIVNPPASAADAYPLASYTYALVPTDTKKAVPLKKFLNYAIGSGQQFGAPLLFAKLPDQIVSADKSTIAKIGG